MRSIFLFICCFVSIGGGIFFGFQGLKEPETSLAKASPVEMKTVWIPTVTSTFEAGTILTKKDVLWLEGNVTEKDTSFLTRAVFDAKPSPFFATKIALHDGNVIEETQVIWPTDEKYIRAILKPEHVAMTIEANAFTVFKPDHHPEGSVIDIYLEQTLDKILLSEVTHTFPLLIASSVRVLKWDLKSQNKGRDSSDIVTIEVSDSELKAIMLARKSGSLVAIAAGKKTMVSVNDPSLEALSILRKHLVSSSSSPSNKQGRQILLQRGATRETISFMGSSNLKVTKRVSKKETSQ